MVFGFQCRLVYIGLSFELCSDQSCGYWEFIIWRLASVLASHALSKTFLPNKLQKCSICRCWHILIWGIIVFQYNWYFSPPTESTQLGFWFLHNANDLTWPDLTWPDLTRSVQNIISSLRLLYKALQFLLIFFCARCHLQIYFTHARN